MGIAMSEERMPSSSLGSSVPLVPPLYQSSVYKLPDLDALDRILDAHEAGFIYARDAHPNSRQLAAQLAEWEGARWALVTSSGMAAISAIVLATVQQGQRIVASHRLYGRTTQLFQQELPRLGVQTTLVDTGDLEEVRRALETPARLLFVETLSNPLLRIADLPALASLAHERDCLLVVDNTFATPVLVRPLEVKADLVMESLTKMIGGHSDITLGLVCGERDLFQEVSQVSSIWGFAANPFDCWLTLRGLSTLSLRMRTASANAAALADWLADQPGVTRVLYPGRRDHLDHKLAASLFRGGFGNMLCFDLAGGREAVNRFMHQAPGIPFSPSLGHTTTTCSHPATTSHRYVSPAEKERQGITDGLVRLSVGVEELDKIKDEMAKGIG
jgi:cystathionine beta-lyase/cystathionine gamma-synthase